MQAFQSGDSGDFSDRGPRRLPRAILLFPGQGTQYIGMGKEVCDTSAATRAVWDCASDVSGVDVRRICLKGPMTLLTDTRYQQIAVTTVNIASLEALRSVADCEVLAAAGHSVGEYSALYAAGVLSLQDTLRAVTARARVMHQLAEEAAGAMYAIKGADYRQIVATIEQLQLAQYVCVANDNTPQQQVISGEPEYVRRLVATLMEQGCKQVKLPVSGAWHSALMRDGEPTFRTTLDSLQLGAPLFPVYMNLIGAPASDSVSVKACLAAHLYSRVRWRDTIDAFCQLRPHSFIEVGPRKILSSMLADFSHLPEQLSILHATDLLGPARLQPHAASIVA